MPLTDIQKVRSLIGDMDKSVIREQVDKGDGASKVFQLDMFPVRTGSVSIFVSAVANLSATVNLALGVLDFTATTVPTSAAIILATYQYNAMSDDEIQNALDLASGNGTLIAASIAARGLAGQASRFFAYTQGAKSVDKKQISKRLLDLAESFEKAHENAIMKGGTTVTVASFDDSGTAYENYDTASALVTATAC